LTIYTTECPRCGGKSEVGMESSRVPPEMKCGECLMAATEVVALIVKPKEAEPCERCGLIYGHRYPCTDNKEG
jgi:reverse gyrase